MYGKEIARAILSHHKIVVTYIRSQSGNGLSHSIDEEASHYTSTIDIKVRIVDTSFGYSGHRIWLYPHKKLLRLLTAQALHKFVSNLICINKRYIQFFSHIARTIKVGSMGVIQRISLNLFFTLAGIGTSILRDGGILWSDKVAAHDSIHQYRIGTALTSLIDNA